MKRMRLNEWMIEVNEKMNQWNSEHQRQVRKTTQRNINSYDVSMPQMFWMFKILKVIHEQSEIAKAEKRIGEQHE